MVTLKACSAAEIVLPSPFSSAEPRAGIKENDKGKGRGTQPLQQGGNLSSF